MTKKQQSQTNYEDQKNNHKRVMNIKITISKELLTSKKQSQILKI